MTVLSDGAIWDRMNERDLDKRLTISYMQDGAIQPASVDLHLSENYIYTGNNFVLPAYIEPSWFYLLSTLESIYMPNDLLGIVCGKSTLAREGLNVEAAGLVDPGFRGQLTLEVWLSSNRSIELTPGMAIAQIYFHELDRPAQLPYGARGRGSHYQSQKGPTLSYREQERMPK